MAADSCCRILLPFLAAGLLLCALVDADSSSVSVEHAPSYLLFAGQTRADAKLASLLTDANHNHVGDSVDISRANSVWKLMRQNAIEFARHKSSEARPTVNRLLKQANVSLECSTALNAVLDHLGQLDSWAVQMYNSFGDFPTSGFFEGSLTSMGSYRQCVDLAPNEHIGQAHYCTYKFQPIVPKRPRFHNILAPIDKLANFTQADDIFRLLAQKAQYYYYTKIRLATCMPSKCAIGDLESLGKQVSLNTFLQFSGVSCLERQDQFQPDGAQVFALIVLAALASISFIGTAIHLLNIRQLISREDSPISKGPFSAQVVLQQQRSLLAAAAANQQKPPILPAPVIQSRNSSDHSRLLKIIDALLHFSIVQNAKKLFDTSTSRRTASRTILPDPSGSTSQSETGSDEDERPTDISCVHGLRFWTISWIIFGHTMQYTEWAGFGRAYQVERNLVSLALQPLLNATFSVDTFFLVSGLLTTYVTWSITRGHYKRFNKFAFLISRYLRLTPQVLLVILLFIIFPLFGDGPYWRGLIQKESDNCKRNWWVNALYLQAFIKQDQICNLVTWWLSIEMFYHLISILVIIALLHSTRKGLLAALVMGGGMTAYSCYLHYVNHYPPNMLPTLPQRYEIWDSIVLKYFWTPYPHAPSYFVGLLLGYALYNRSITSLTRSQVRYGWLAFLVCYLSILYGTHGWNNNAPYSRLSSTLYYNLSQVCWSLATGWAILACALGHGGWLNTFLSSPVFVPLGRATYMTYLSHMMIVMSYPAKMNLLIEPSYLVFLYIFISNLFLSYGFGIVLTLVYESPILHLQKLFVRNMASKFNEDSPAKKLSEAEKIARLSLYAQQQVSVQENGT